MKKKVLLICFVSLLTMSVQASDNTQNSALSILNAFMKTNSTNVGSSNVQNQIEAFNKNLNESSLKLQNAVQMIARTMTTDTQAELLTKQLNEINNNIKLTEAEKEALLTEVYKEFANSLKENQNVLSKELESYSSKQSISRPRIHGWTYARGIFYAFRRRICKSGCDTRYKRYFYGSA